ncbi:hypothetical protein HAX54_001268, partial [Datura stramonium]|nr:hypothetical protein [Datura stramonium]
MCYAFAARVLHCAERWLPHVWHSTGKRAASHQPSRIGEGCCTPAVAPGQGLPHTRHNTGCAVRRKAYSANGLAPRAWQCAILPPPPSVSLLSLLRPETSHLQPSPLLVLVVSLSETTQPATGNQSTPVNNTKDAKTAPRLPSPSLFAVLTHSFGH